MADLNAAREEKPQRSDYGGEQVTRSAAAINSGLPSVGTQQNSPWFYKYKQSRWFWHRDREAWYIDLGYLTLMPGVGGMSNDRSSIQAATMETAAKGWTVIDWEDQRLPRRFHNYCKGYDLARGGKTFVSIFHGPDVLDDENEWQRDDDRYFEFLDALVTCGIVRARTERMCRKAINRAKSAVDRLTQDLKANPGHRQIEGRFMVATKRLAKMLGHDAERAELDADVVIEDTRADGKLVADSEKVSAKEYPCASCGKSFTTPQGRAAHKRHCKGAQHG